MKHFMKCGVKKVILSLFLLGFLGVFFLPAPGLALTSEFGIADVTWSVSTLTYTNAVGASVPVNWLDPTLADTRNSFGSAWIALNGVETADAGFVEGAWTAAGISTSLADATGNVGGSGQTQGFPNTAGTRGAVQAISDITLNGAGSANVFEAQAAFTGQFTVPSAGILSITAPYLLSLTLNNTGGFSAGEVTVGLVLSNFDITDPATGQSLILASDIRSYANSLLGAGTILFTDQDFTNPLGPLALTFQLLPGINYDFEVFASTTASAVPEPGTLVLLGLSMVSIAGLRRWLKE